MKLNIEHIEFTRGENPFKSLNIGKRVEIDNWFETWAPDAIYKIDDNLNIKVKNSLWFENSSQVTSLPDNLYIEGFLDLERTDIASLPSNLHVEGYLDIRQTKITSLPDDLYIEGVIHKDF